MSRTMLIYILSPSFSGSTLLTMLLAPHTRIASVGELKATSMGAIDDYLCSCGTRLLNCSFWRELQSVLAASGVELRFDDFETHFKNGPGVIDKLLGAGVRGHLFEAARSTLIRWTPPTSRAWRNKIDRIHSVMNAIMHIQGGDIFLDSSKDCIRLQHLIQANRWDIKVVRIDRDGRGVVNSIKKRHRIDIDNAIREWKYTMREQHNVWRSLPDHAKLLIRYEDLCHSPQAELERIEAFTGIDGLIDCQSSAPLHLLGNPMRTAGGLDIKLDEKWRDELEAVELTKFETEAGHTNRLLGYSSR